MAIEFVPGIGMMILGAVLAQAPIIGWVGYLIFIIGFVAVIALIPRN